MDELLKRRCLPCEKGMPAISSNEVRGLLKRVPGWNLAGKTISREFRFKDFVEAMKFVNTVAELSEAEAHHPDIAIHYNRVTLILWTHVAHGLTENDFIVASKVNNLTAA